MDASQEITAPKPLFPPTETLDLSVFDLRKGKAINGLINNKSNTSVKSKNAWHEFYFISSVYVSSINLYAINFETFHEATLEIEDVFGNLHVQNSKFDGSKFEFKFGLFAKEFRIKPDKRWFSDPRLNRVEVLGYSGESYQGILKIFDNPQTELNSLNENIQSLKTSVADLEISVTSLLDRKSQFEKEVSDLNASKDAIDKNIIDSKDNLDKLASKQGQQTDRIKSLEADLLALNKEKSSIIEENNTNIKHLRKLKDEIRLFPSEISGFVEESNSKNLKYLFYMAPFVVVLCAIAYKMYNNAVDLSVVYKQGDIDVWSIFITRLPYVVVSVAIIQSCAFFVNKLTNEIIAVDRKRLNLSTLSIIARDVSRSSAFGKKFTDEERYEKEIHLKMEMMKDHMRQYISEDFAYKSPFDFLSTLSRHRQDKQSDTKAAMDSKPTQP